MRCDRSHELISAILDGEGAGSDDDLSAHLDGCTACQAWAEQARALHRSLRLQTAPRVPDLTAAILNGPRAEGHRRPSPTRRLPSLAVLRAALGAIATTQLVLAAPELLARAAEHGHATRHLGAWDVAFAVGLLVVAAQPWRARGLLPMAGAVAGVMVLTGVIDAMSGGTPGMAEATHLLEVCGLALLWAIARGEENRLSGGGGGWRPLPWTRAAGGRRSPAGWLARSARAPLPLPQLSAMLSDEVASLSASSRITASRARATRERTVPIGQSHTSAVSA
jgi:predicted anti-sigma-YlaC factor YlaD